MTPPGVTINKTAVCIIIGLLGIIVLGFKYRKGGNTFVDSLKEDKSGLQVRDFPEAKVEESKKELETKNQADEANKKPEGLVPLKETQLNKPVKMTAAIPDWKTVDLDSFEIPKDIIEAAESKDVEERQYKIMGMEITAKKATPDGKCKGGIILLHGQAFSSKEWLKIKTLQFIAAMGYTPFAVDLPGYGGSGNAKLLHDTTEKVKFMEELINITTFDRPVIISPSMSGSFALPFLLNDVKNADKKSHGYIPVAPVVPQAIKDRIKDLQIPTAVVYGENDANFRDIVENVLSKIPNSRLFKIKNAGHPAYINNTPDWHKVLYVFLPAAFKN